MVTKKIKHKNENGTVVEVEIGAEAQNVTEDPLHRFITDAEKTKLAGIEEGADVTPPGLKTGYVTTGQMAGTILGIKATAEGDGTTASGESSHAEGDGTTASKYASHAEGAYATASGESSHAEGQWTTATGNCAHAEGRWSIASGNCAHAEGDGTTASGESSHAEGNHTTASKYASHAEGVDTKASGNCAHAEGILTTASGESSHAEGNHTTASNYASHSQGKYNKEMTSGATSNNTVGDAFVIGNGTGNSALSNAFRVTYSGQTYGLSAFAASGADYAEFFEWLDGNPLVEDRVGYFVTLDRDKIRLANSGDYVLGVVSGNPCIIGNGDEDWLGRWLHDDFGRFVKEDVDTPVTEWRKIETGEYRTITDAEGNEVQEPVTETREVETGEVIHGWRYKANPDYDYTQKYIERKDRPEWDCVGMLGVLSVRDDGTCQVNSYCTVNNGGIATASDQAGWRVIGRISDNVIRIVFR